MSSEGAAVSFEPEKLPSAVQNVLHCKEIRSVYIPAKHFERADRCSLRRSSAVGEAQNMCRLFLFKFKHISSLVIRRCFAGALRVRRRNE